MLHKLGADVVGYAFDPRTVRDHFEVCGVSERITDIRGDICDYERLQQVCSVYKPEIVFHLAAQALVLASYQDVRGTYATNVMGTLNVLECIKECPETRCAVLVTTDKCYENEEQIWGYRETDRLGGYDPYSSSKACAEILISSFRDSFFHAGSYEANKKAVATARAGNVIGGGDWAPDRIVSDCVQAFLRDEKVSLRNPSAVRPWQHVLEPLYGYLLLAQRLYQEGEAFAEAWNFGPDMAIETNVRELVGLLAQEFGTGALMDVNRQTTAYEAAYLALDTTKARRRLGWRPQLAIADAVAMTAQWYKQYDEMKDEAGCRNEMYALSSKQIDEYLSMVME